MPPLNTLDSTSNIGSAWNLAMSDGQVSAEEAKNIVAVLKADGISDTERQQASIIVANAKVNFEMAEEGVWAAEINHANVSSAVTTNALALGESGGGVFGSQLALMRQAKAAERQMQAAKATKNQESGNLRSAQRILGAIIVTASLDKLENEMSRSIFDWSPIAITNGEARAGVDAVVEAGEHLDLFMMEALQKESGLYLERLIDQLPEDGRNNINQFRQLLDTLAPGTKQRLQNGLSADAWERLSLSSS
jgi:hypothetical protein